MSIQKYKPKHSPRTFDDQPAVEKVNQSVKRSREAIGRSRGLMLESRQVVETAQKLRAKRH